MAIDKVINPFSIKQGKNVYPVYIHIQSKDKHACKYFAISGVIISPHRRRDRIIAGGQIIISLREKQSSLRIYNAGFNDDIINQLFAIWDEYQLSRGDLPEATITFLNSLPDSKTIPKEI